MIHYHVWFALKPEMTETEGLAALRAFIAELTQRGHLARATVLKNSGAAPKSKLLPYHALFEFADDAQMDAAFATKRTDGIHTGPHGALMAAVAAFHVEVFREL